MASCNGKTSTDRSRVVQTADPSLVADESSVGTPTNVGLETLLRNWHLHDVKMQPYHETRKKYIWEGRIPNCRNMEGKKQKFYSKKKREVIEIDDPWSYAVGKALADQIAIETWASYAGIKNRKWTWSHMEGCRKACWHFLEEWIHRFKNKDIKRQVIFGTCFMMLCDIEDGLRKKELGANWQDAVDVTYVAQSEEQVKAKIRINPWTDEPVEEEEKRDLARLHKVNLEQQIDEERCDDQNMRLSWFDLPQPTHIKFDQFVPKPCKFNADYYEFPKAQALVEEDISVTPMTAEITEVERTDVDLVTLFANLCREYEKKYQPDQDSPMGILRYVEKMCITPLTMFENHAEEMEVELPFEELMEIDEVFEEVAEEIEVDVDGDEEPAQIERALRGKKTKVDSEFAIEFKHSQKLRRQAVEEITEYLRKADPFNLVCKCWLCVEKFIKRNPKCLHNQYHLRGVGCVHEDVKVPSDRYNFVRMAHRQRCLEVQAGNLPDWQLCSHEWVDWADFSDMTLTTVDDMEWDDFEQDEIAQAQAEDGALEEVETVTKSQNITFVDERPVDHVETYIGSSTSSRDINNDIAESPWNLSQILTREIRVATATWNLKHKPFEQIVNLTFPKCMIHENSQMSHAALRPLGYLRAGVEFRAQFNGNRFNLGRCVGFFIPLMWKDDDDMFPWKNFANLPHFFLDASVSNSATLMVPYTHILTHFVARRGFLVNDSINCLGRFIIMCLNPLRAGEGAPNEFTITIYAKMVEPVIHQAMWPSDDFSFTKTDGLVAFGDDSIWERAAATGVGQALGSVLKLMTGGLATGVGSWLTNLIFDKPLDPRPAVNVINRAVPPLCHGAGPDNSIRLALSPISQTESDPKMLATEFNDLDLRTILQVPQWLFSGTIGTETTEDTEIFKIPICPTYIPDDDMSNTFANGVSQYRPTVLAYSCRGFLYQRGGLVYKIQFITSQFHSMRVVIVHNPLMIDGQTPNIDQMMNLNTTVVDIQEQKEIVIQIPFESPIPWIRCDHFRPRAVPAPGAMYGLGTLSMYVVNRLVAPENVSQTIDFNVYISAAPDFELSVPVPIYPLNVKNDAIDHTFIWPPYVNASSTADRNSAGNTGEFGNKDIIDSLYKHGRVLYAEGKIKYSTAYPDYWWMCDSLPEGLDNETIQWVWKASSLNYYNTDKTSIQWQYMVSKNKFTKKWREPQDPWEAPAATKYLPDPNLKIQAKVEQYTTDRESHGSIVIPTKGFSTSEAAPTTVSENAMNLQTVMRRYYPYFMDAPIYNGSGFTLFSIPVTPTSQAQPRLPVGKQFGAPPIMHHIAYFSRLWTYFRGGLRFKFLFHKTEGTDVYVWFDPSVAIDFRAFSSIPESEVMRNLSFASLATVSYLQGCVEVEVPYQSQYNQLLIDITGRNKGLLAQNGTLFFAIRNKIPDVPDRRDPLNLSIFISTADDFVLNLYRGPTFVYEPIVISNDIEGEEGIINVTYDALTTVYDKPGYLPGVSIFKTGFGVWPLKCGANRDRNNLETMPTIEEEEEGLAKAFCQARPFDESGLKFKPAQMVTNLKTIIEECVDEQVEDILLDDNWAQAQGLFNDLRRCKQEFVDTAASVRHIIKQADDTKLCENLSSILSKANNLTENISNVTKSATAEAITKYSILSAEILTVGSFIYALKECLSNLNLKNLIFLAITTAATLGFAFSNALHSVISNVVGWALGSHELPQAQALDGALADVIDGNSKTICSIVAVIGTVFYAYIFGVLPSLITIKTVIKNIFEGEDEKEVKKEKKAKAHALNGLIDLRSAHFSVMGISALDKVYNKSMDYVSRFLDWILDRENPEVITARLTEGYKQDVLDCVQELDMLDNEDYFTQAMHDPFIHNRFYRLQTQINRLTRVGVTDKLDTRVMTLITECRKRCQKLIKDLERDSPKPILRYDPFCICLAGESGTGKTKLMSKVAKWVQEEMDLPEFNLIYPKGIKDEFWSGYKNQPIVFWDEFAQSRKMDEVIPEFMTLRGSTPVMLNMAALNDKGKYFTSQCIIMTTNVPYENFNTVRDQLAFKRRRHILIDMEHKAGFNAVRMQNAGWNDFPNWEHCDFRIKSSVSNRILRGPWGLNEIERVVRQRVRDWHHNQTTILREADVPIEMPRGIVPVPNVDRDVVALVEEEMQELVEQDRQAAEAEVAFHEQQEQALDAVGQQMLNEELASNPDSDIALPDEYRHEEILPPPPEDVLEQARAFGILENIEKWTKKNDEHCEDIPLDDSVECDEEDEFFDAPEPPLLSFIGRLPAVSAEPWLFEEMHGIVNKNASTSWAVAEDCSEEDKPIARSFIRTYSMIPLHKRIVFPSLWESIKMQFGELWQTCKAVFNSIKEKIYNFIDNNPRIAKVVGALTLFTGVGAALFAFGSSKGEPLDPEGFYEHGPGKVARMKVVPEGFYEHGPGKVPRARVVAEGCDDPVAFQICKKIHSAICPIGWTSVKEGKVVNLRCVRIGGSYILLPRHFFDRRVKDDEFTMYHRFNFLKFRYDPSKIIAKEGKDWCLYDLGLRIDPAPHIIKYFISGTNLGRGMKLDGLLCGVTKEGVQTMTQCAVEGIAQFEYEDVFGESVYKQLGWHMAANTEPGDCGSVLMGLSKNLPPPGKILGIHVAGYHNKPKGYSVLITREQIEDLLKDTLIHSPVAVCQGVDLDIPLEKIKLIPDGDFTIVGQMCSRMRVMQPPQTDLRETPWKEDLKIVCPKKPAHLMPFVNNNGIRISPLSIALRKYGQPNDPLPINSVNKISKFLKDYLEDNLKAAQGKRVFEVKDAVMGIEGIPFAERLNMKSSPGWPYQVEERQGAGKYRYFDGEGNIVHTVLEERLRERILAAEKFKRVPSLWRDCLKDELRPNEKVDEGKTRLFTIAPLDFTIAVRMYFFDFVIAFYSASGSKFFSAVGIDPESFDWTVMYNFLREISNDSLAGDFSVFDGGLKPEVFEIAVDAINAWYGDDVKNQNVRKILFHEMLHTMQLVNDCVYLTHVGNPSGNPLTVIINTIGNLIYFLCAWLYIYPDRSCSDFFDQVHTKLYGDDAIVTVSKQAKKFNQNSVTQAFASFGIKFTPESKTNEEVADFRPLDSVTFLKRGFRRDEEVGSCFVLPVMSLDTLNSFLFYYRKTESDDEDQLRMNMRAAIDFAFFHGREFYDSYNELWKECMRKCHFNPLSISYEEQLDRFLIKCCAAGMIDQAQAQAMESFMKVTNHRWTRRMVGVLEAVPYYFCAALGIGQGSVPVRTDDRWAVSIPSGEGKSTLCRLHPKIFVDHDELLIPAFTKSKTKLNELPWLAENARKFDFPKEDRRILLVHSPKNTNRNLIGSIITPTPTYIRSNIIHRLLQQNPYVMGMNERNAALLQIARMVEPSLFGEIT